MTQASPKRERSDQDVDSIDQPRTHVQICHQSESISTSCQEPFLNPSQRSDSKPQQENLPSPPDGGYGWFIVLGSFITHVIIGSLERSEGLFFLYFQENFKQSAQLTAWPGAIASTIRLMSGSIASAFSSRYSVRTCDFCGGMLLFLSLFFTSHAPNFYFLFISHGLIQGLGLGLFYAPCLIIVGMYFDRRRGLSTGLATAGVGVGAFVFVPIIQLLFDTYGMSGSFLILSAFSLHSALVAMLHRPLQLHYKFSGMIYSQQRRHECDYIDKENRCLSDFIEPAVSAASSNTERNGSKWNSSFDSIERPGQLKEQYCRDCIISSCNILLPREDSRFVKQVKNKIYHFYLLKNLAFLWYCCSVMMYTASNKSCLTFIPSLVKSKGFSDAEAAVIVSIMGGFDTIGRMGFGAIFDLSCLRPNRPLFYNIFLALLASTGFIFPLIDNYIGLCVVAAMYGLLAGGFISQKSVIIVDILGVQHMASSFGMLILFQGFGAGIGPPLSGLFRDVFGSFTEVFYLGGGMLTIGTLFMTFSNIFLRRQRQKDAKPKDCQ